MQYANFYATKWTNTKITKTNLVNSCFSYSSFSKVSLDSVDFSDSEFIDTQLADIDFSTSNIDGIKITMSSLNKMIVNSFQALSLAGFLGLKIKD